MVLSHALHHMTVRNCQWHLCISYVMTIEMRCNITFLVLWCHWHWHWYHIKPAASSIALQWYWAHAAKWSTWSYHNKHMQYCNDLLANKGVYSHTYGPCPECAQDVYKSLYIAHCIIIYAWYTCAYTKIINGSRSPTSVLLHLRPITWHGVMSKSLT